MDRELLPIRHEENLIGWLNTNLPQVRIRAAAGLSAHTYLVLLTKSDADKVKRFLLTGVSPPFVRRYTSSTGSAAPGIRFDFSLTTEQPEKLEALIKSCQLLLQTSVDSSDQTFVQQQLNLAKARLEKLR